MMQILLHNLDFSKISSPIETLGFANSAADMLVFRFLPPPLMQCWVTGGFCHKHPLWRKNLLNLLLLNTSRNKSQLSALNQVLFSNLASYLSSHPQMWRVKSQRRMWVILEGSVQTETWLDLENYLFCILDLFQEGPEFLGLGVQCPAHGLVVVGGVWWTREVWCAQLKKENDWHTQILWCVMRYIVWD